MGASLSFAQLRQALLRGRIEPVYLLVGEEPHLHDAAIRLLERAALREGAPGLDRESVRGHEATLAEVLDLASTYPMGGGRRFVVVRDAHRLPADDAGPLKAYMARPHDRACLVFSAGKLDRRRALTKALEQGAARVACDPLDEARTAAWARERLMERGFGISPELAEAIAAGLAGAGLGRLDAELEKLMSGIAPPRPIEADDLAMLGSAPRVGDAFKTAAQVARGARAEALRSVRSLLRSGEEPLMLLGGMAWYFRNALKARSAASRRVPAREIMAQYGLRPDRVEVFERETARASVEDLTEALRLCLRADREIKGLGARDAANALERLVHRIGRRVGERA